jgi:DNA-binding transcriptional MerR regulator
VLERLKVIRLCRRAGHSITAIRRLMQAVDAGGEIPVGELEALSATPSEDERAMFNTFPSDVLIETLRQSVESVGEIRACLLELREDIEEAV